MRKAIPKKIKDKVKMRFGGRCGYCGLFPEKTIYIDHIHPVADRRFPGDINDESNLMPACFQCNSFKGTFTVAQFRYEIAQQITRAFKYSVNFRMAVRHKQIKLTPKRVVFYFEENHGEN